MTGWIVGLLCFSPSLVTYVNIIHGKISLLYIYSSLYQMTLLHNGISRLTTLLLYPVRVISLVDMSLLTNNKNSCPLLLRLVIEGGPIAL